jgi:hypothetical protein
MPDHPHRHEAEASLAVATVCPGFDRQGWITAIAAVLLALITLFTSYDHVSVLGTTAIDLPQQAGIPCIAAALAAAIEQQVGIQQSTRKCSDTRWSRTSSS